jgi:hypothetical protein
MRKVDGLSLIFIDFYVPALTPRLNSSYISLQLSQELSCKLRTAYKPSARTKQKAVLLLL